MFAFVDSHTHSYEDLCKMNLYIYMYMYIYIYIYTQREREREREGRKKERQEKREGREGEPKRERERKSAEFLHVKIPVFSMMQIRHLRRLNMNIHIMIASHLRRL